MRTTGQAYGAADDIKQKYAGMEADEGSGMSHTLWRQYDSSSGRWTSPDPYGGSMGVTDPQSFNRYTYVNNDPVNLVDPSGLMLSDIGVYQTEDPDLARKLENDSTRELLDHAGSNWILDGVADGHIPLIDTSDSQSGGQAQGGTAGSTDVTGYDLITSGTNPAPSVDHPEIPELKDPGTYQNVNGAFFAFFLKVDFDAGANIADYQHLRTAFVVDGKGRVFDKKDGPNENPSGARWSYKDSHGSFMTILV